MNRVDAYSEDTWRNLIDQTTEIADKGLYEIDMMYSDLQIMYSKLVVNDTAPESLMHNFKLLLEKIDECRDETRWFLEQANDEKITTRRYEFTIELQMCVDVRSNDDNHRDQAQEYVDFELGKLSGDALPQLYWTTTDVVDKGETDTDYPEVDCT